MDTLLKILSIAMPEMFMCSLDLTDAYLMVLIAFIFTRFLKSEWKGQLFKFLAMPFSLTEASETTPVSDLLFRLHNLRYLETFFNVKKQKNCVDRLCVLHTTCLFLWGFYLMMKNPCNNQPIELKAWDM